MPCLSASDVYPSQQQHNFVEQNIRFYDYRILEGYFEVRQFILCIVYFVLFITYYELCILYNYFYLALTSTLVSQVHFPNRLIAAHRMIPTSSASTSTTVI